MTVGWLVAAYLAAGVACAVAIVVRARPSASSFASAAAAVVVWPLWAPFVLLAPCHQQPASAVERRVSSALERARQAVSGSQLDGFLSERDVRSILDEVTRIARRLAAIETELAQSEPGSPRRARRHERLTELRAADHAALEEIAELCELLATELSLARYGRGEGVEPLVSELSIRVEALAAT